MKIPMAISIVTRRPFMSANLPYRGVAAVEARR